MDTFGARIRRLRLVEGLDQSELSARIGVSQGSISKIESGRLAAASIADVARLARALRCHETFLQRSPDLAPASKPWLRAYADASGRALDRQLADCDLVIESIEHLRLKTLPDEIPLYHGDVTDDEELEQFALDVRQQAGFGPTDVIGHAVRAAERLGCIVLPMREELGRHLGLSLRSNLTPVVCVSRPTLGKTVPGDRQRFTVAHEIGHLALHSGLGAPQTAEDASRIERQAHRFAAAFLTPADALLEDLRDEGGRVTLRTLSAIKAHWGVSIKALVTRFNGLGVIDDEHARSLYKQISARGWSKAEPVEVPNESAVWMDKAIRAKFRRSADPIQDAADQLGLNRSHLERWIDWTEVSAAIPADVIDLSARRTSNLRH